MCMKCNNLHVKSLLDATESKIQVGFTTGSPALKDLQWNTQQLNLNSTKSRTQTSNFKKRK